MNAAGKLFQSSIELTEDQLLIFKTEPYFSPYFFLLGGSKLPLEKAETILDTLFESQQEDGRMALYLKGIETPFIQAPLHAGIKGGHTSNGPLMRARTQRQHTAAACVCVSRVCVALICVDAMTWTCWFAVRMIVANFSDSRSHARLRSALASASVAASVVIWTWSLSECGTLYARS